MKTLEIYCDGSCRLNEIDKPGTCALVVVEGNTVIHKDSYYYKDTTNNRMELQGLIHSLKWVKENHPTKRVYTHMDSQYVQLGVTSWMKSWIKRDWRTSDKKPVANEDLWRQIDVLQKELQSVQYQWVRGHNNNKYNEMADKLCTQAYSSKPTTEEKQQWDHVHNADGSLTVSAPGRQYMYVENELKEANKLILEMYKETLENRPVRLRDKVQHYLQKHKLI